MQAWLAAAPAERALAVRRAVVLTHADWLERIECPAELYDLAVWSLSGLILPTTAARAACTAAAELAIVCAVWPGPVDLALRAPRLRRLP